MAQDIPGPLDVNSFAELNFQRNQLNIDIPKAESRINDVTFKADTSYLFNSSLDAKKNMDYYKKIVDQFATKKDTSGISKAKYGYEFYSDQFDQLNRKLSESRSANKELIELKKSLSDKKGDLLRIQSKISQLMIPKINQQNLMFWAGIGFVLLMCILLGTFYFVVKTDSIIRGIIFSGDSGIQFIALFSIIVAIILLGLTGVLEGKELSALLGSVAGYILGKVKFSSASSNPSPGPDQNPDGNPNPVDDPKLNTNPAIA
ncbi:hypothetical protein A0256_18195 [Mucilaginibacter sp. PAMC 26640]|nr:hypothetical protein A0256_18195 [Mucilaginibacter sp. PAMC 26640]